MKDKSPKTFIELDEYELEDISDRIKKAALSEFKDIDELYWLANFWFKLDTALENLKKQPSD